MIENKLRVDRARFIVFEGLDGAGKSTQIRMLIDYFARRQVNHKLVHFPRISEGIIGEMIAKFLRGEFGKASDINPYFVAMMYAQDRNNAKYYLAEYMENYQYLIVDRYVYSNIAFQCAKINGESQKEELRDWILKLEYENNALLKPDITLYLKVPFDRIKYTLSRSRNGEDREYLKGNPDIHENDLVLQKRVEDEYLKLAAIDTSFKIIDCGDLDNQLLRPAAINDAIIQLLAMLYGDI